MKSKEQRKIEMRQWWLREIQYYLLPVESKDIDINTPFFGNSGATVPVESKSVNLRDELIKEFISETSEEELRALKAKIEGLGIEGPTFDEYLAGGRSKEVNRRDDIIGCFKYCYGTNADVVWSKVWDKVESLIDEYLANRLTKEVMDEDIEKISGCPFDEDLSTK
jgi:hypothetical protein